MVSRRLGVRVLVVVAIVVLGIYGGQMRRRRAYCLAMAEEHRGRAIMPAGRSFSGPARTAKEEEREKNPHAGLRAEHSLTQAHLRKLREMDPHAAWHLNLGDGYLRPPAAPGRRCRRSLATSPPLPARVRLDDYEVEVWTNRVSASREPRDPSRWLLRRDSGLTVGEAIAAWGFPIGLWEPRTESGWWMAEVGERS